MVHLTLDLMVYFKERTFAYTCYIDGNFTEICCQGSDNMSASRLFSATVQNVDLNQQCRMVSTS